MAGTKSSSTFRVRKHHILFSHDLMVSYASLNIGILFLSSSFSRSSHRFWRGRWELSIKMEDMTNMPNEGEKGRKRKLLIPWLMYNDFNEHGFSADTFRKPHSLCFLCTQGISKHVIYIPVGQRPTAQLQYPALAIELLIDFWSNSLPVVWPWTSYLILQCQSSSGKGTGCCGLHFQSHWFSSSFWSSCLWKNYTFPAWWAQ